ncbi:MAG: aldehyde dehydrogenase family protein [Exiguobacterium chiriqhucha]|uniref:aldehyde dehydrogenase family protein n=1 Tax=Exiguobacterium TaxID=33986 RepID=UPI00049850DF|nr:MULTISPECIES: aldehyde dehydrogenase family protein [Exiguobacterium]TCI69195.1 aldehyde dehydrogenase family protein [Exiguobacterium sp. IPCI3]TCI78654.1 aldehyde dehydrogenase family protein [Exiguobacterium sp. IPCH1]TCI81158.1 aldehyde dehydrogenase family protein [Exiguobacterium sp. IPBC4]
MHTDFTKMYIDGQWVEGSSDKSIDNTNPFTDETLFSIRSADESDLDKAYAVAKEAQTEWATMLPQNRRALIEKFAEVTLQHKEDIIEWLVKESGSTRIKAEGEFLASMAIIKEAATFPFRMDGLIKPSIVPNKENRVYRKPLGVIGVISPWNFPFHLAVRSIVSALATGNTVVVKPATATPVTGGLLFASLFEEAGLPKGVLNVVVGRGSEIGDAIVEHPVPKLISFTGSTEVGKGIAEKAGRLLKKTALELGGNNVFVVLDDADIDRAVESAVYSKFYHQGQICMSTNRILVAESIHDAFLEKFVERVRALKFGNPNESDTQVGPLIDHDQVDRILDQIKQTVDAGATLQVGGNADGNVLEPTVVSGVTNDMPLAKNEIFGPVAVILSFKDDAEALKLSNELPYGLSGAVHGSIYRATEFARQVETGMIHVNDQSVNDEPHLPFGGEKDSGLGRFNGEWVLEEFTTLQWVSVMHERREYKPFFS